MAMHEHLPALATKIGKILAIKPEYLVTQPAELRILREMSEEEVREFAKSHGWRVIRRLGGRQIEFYNYSLDPELRITNGPVTIRLN
jgi:hypothetical protein